MTTSTLTTKCDEKMWLSDRFALNKMPCSRMLSRSRCRQSPTYVLRPSNGLPILPEEEEAWASRIGDEGKHVDSVKKIVSL